MTVIISNVDLLKLIKSFLYVILITTKKMTNHSCNKLEINKSKVEIYEHRRTI